MTDSSGAVAVIGAACRFPGSADLDAFWSLLRGADDAVGTPSDAELLAAGVTPDELADPEYVRAVLRTPGLDRFDAGFFGLGADEADRCDPQLRLLLEICHTAVEQAGYDVTAVAGGAAVFAAARAGRYRGLHLLPDGFETSADGRDEPDPAGFVAVRLGLRGPAVTLGSCSLLAVSQAVQALQTGACDLALAGGVHVELPDGHGYRWSPGGRRPPDGRTRPFDAAAAGSVHGSGAGVVVLKRLAEAVSDGDRILAVVLAGASACGDAGAAAAEALTVAGCAPDRLSYVEAHGAATGREDAAELAALTDGFALAGGVPAAGSVAVGAVRSHVGDLGPAGGVAGLLKTVLALHHEHLPATLHIGVPHPALASRAFRLARRPAPWPRTGDSPRRAAVHAVAPGGTSTILVLEEGIRPVPAGTPQRDRVVVWSGRDARSAELAGARLAQFFASCPEPDFADAVATLQHGRTVHPVRRAAVCAGAAEATRPEVVVPGPARAVVLDFPAGPPAPLTLYGVQPTLTEHADVCLEALERHGLDAYGRWTRGPGDPVPTDPMLLFAGQYALGMLWRTWGVRPRAVTGAGPGLLAAAVVAGAADLDDAARLLAGGGSYRLPATPIPVRCAVTGDQVDALVWPPAGDRPPRRWTDAEPVLTVRVGGDPGLRELMGELARLWVHGVDVDWAAVEPDHPLQRVAVPGHPLRPERHWTVPSTGPAAPRQGATVPAPAPAAAVVVAGLPDSAEALRPLGRTEHAFWILEQLVPDSGVSNIGIAFRAARPLRWYPLQTAVTQLVRRHPALRLRFPEPDGTPLRHLTAPGDASVSVPTRTTTPDRLVADLQAFLHEPFDLRTELPFRAGHFTLPDGGSVVALAAHHIVVDAPSIQILVEELGRMYDGITTSGKIPDDLAETAPLLGEPEPAPESVRYWLDHLRGVDPAAMVLPGSRPAPARPTFAGHTCSWPMTPDAQEAMRSLSRRLHTTDNIVLMSVFCLTLLRHGAGPDLVVGIPVGTRRPATAGHVGFGVSTMPLRVRVDPAAGFAELAGAVADTFFAGIEHADAPVERVLTERGHGTGDWRVPLFRHMFNYRPWSDEKIRICGEIPEYIEDLFDRSRIDLQVVAVPEPDRFTLRCWHSTEVQDEADVAAFVARMQSLLVRAAAQPQAAVGRLPWGSADDDALVDRLNRTGRDWDSPHTVIEQIAAGAAADPTAVAAVDGGRDVTYGELLGRAAAVRDLLRAHGVGPGEVVALAIGRSTGLAAAVLGVWAVGAAYLPLQSGQPAARTAYQVRDAGARLVLTDGTADLPGVVPVTTLPQSVADGALLDAPPAPEAAAYVIYTSGSTGQPKAVVVTHRNLHNLVSDFAERLPAGSGRAVLWSTAFTFDISALELLLPLTTGGTLVVAPDDALLQPRALLDLVRAADVSLVQATPTAWRLIAPEARDELTGRVLLCGGEPLPASLARRLRTLGGPLFNVYGPTETTIWSTAARLDADPDDPVPIGVPLANTRVFIADAAGQSLPPGVPGELCIAGDGVSDGYLNRPELTGERFGEHPVHGRFYRTGDVARLRHDGALELAGRIDRQVKLRGHRIELDEIEAVLDEHPDVDLAAVVLAGDPQGDGRLVAFVQPRPGTGRGALPDALWRHARDTLPGAAVPSAFVLLDRLPTTPNGKIDQRALRALDQSGTAAAAQPVHSADPELVDALTGLWREALRRPGVGPHDNFFLNGGHSILAARLAGRIEEVTGHTAGVRAVFRHPTPAELATALTGPPT